VIDAPVAASQETYYLRDGRALQSARGLRVASGFPPGLGLTAAVGRSLVPSDFRDDAPPVAVLGDHVWRQRFGADPAIVGRVITVEAESLGAAETFTVVGVMPPGFFFGRDSTAVVDLMRPATAPMRAYMVKLREGVAPATAEARLTAAVRAVAGPLPDNWRGVRLESVRSRYVERARPVLLTALAISGLVFLVVVANAGALALIRTIRRRQEFAVRTALGGGRGRLARMLIVEALVTSAGGLALGASSAAVLLSVAAPAIEAQLGRATPAGPGALTIGGPVLVALSVIAAGVSLVIALTILVAPAEITETLRQSTRSTTDSRSSRRWRHLAVGAEVAGAALVLMCAGLLTESAVRLVRAEVGFPGPDLIRARIRLKAADYPDGSFERFYRAFAERAAADGLPTAFASWPPFNELPTRRIDTDDARLRSGTVASTAGFLAVGPGFFGTVGQPVLQGREFTGADDQSGPMVAMVSAALAHALWPGASAIGERVRAVERTAGGERPGPWRVVVGVVGDVAHTYRDRDARDLYTPTLQEPAGRFASFYARARAHAPVEPTLDELGRIAADIDANAALELGATVAGQNRERAGAMLVATVAGVLAAGAALLAVIGLYGAASLSIEQRRREIAVRTALGARRYDIVRALSSEAWRTTALGVTAGIAASTAAAPLLAAYLYDVPPFRWSTAAAVATVLALAAAVAVFMPAWRASGRAAAADL
jgi:putative ABC transport system permease protein